MISASTIKPKVSIVHVVNRLGLNGKCWKWRTLFDNKPTSCRTALCSTCRRRSQCVGATFIPTLFRIMWESLLATPAQATSA